MRWISTFLFVAIALLTVSCASEQTAKEKTFKFVSFPDFFNFDVPEPWPDWDDAVNFFLDEVEKEQPNYVLVTGDLVDGRWWDGPECVKTNGAVYYSAWIRRMEQHNLRYYTAVGDHELGDDPWPKAKQELVPYFEKAYTDHLKMPQNGPENKKGLAYYVKEGPVLMITVETFELMDDTIYSSVVGEQLEWFKKVLEENKDVPFKIVQGHVALYGKDIVRDRSSSRLFLHNEKETEFYKVMKAYGVDAYLCGEFHATTVTNDDGIWQIVHGSSWGRKVVNTEDYMVCEATEDELKFTLKAIYMEVDGGHIWNVNKPKGPREIVRIQERSLKNGPEITGTLVIKNDNGKKTVTEKTGYFAEFAK